MSICKVRLVRHPQAARVRYLPRHIYQPKLSRSSLPGNFEVSQKGSSLLKKSRPEVSAVSNRAQNVQKQGSQRPNGGQKRTAREFFNSLIPSRKLGE